MYSKLCRVIERCCSDWIASIGCRKSVLTTYRWKHLRTIEMWIHLLFVSFLKLFSRTSFGTPSTPRNSRAPVGHSSRNTALNDYPLWTGHLIRATTCITYVGDHRTTGIPVFNQGRWEGFWRSGANIITHYNMVSPEFKRNLNGSFKHNWP